MANIKSFPNNQDEYIGAEYIMKWLHGRTSGVFAADNNAAVSAVQSAMSVAVSDGLGWMANSGQDGVVWWNDHEAVNGAKLTLAIDAADSYLNRIDRIIVEWQTTNYVAYPEIKVLAGSLAKNPSAPALTNNSTVRQISLAKVYVAAGTTEITASMITDERLDASVCGLVTEALTIDTTMINAQFTNLLERIQNNLKQIMDGQLADQSVTNEKLADGSVSINKLSEETKKYIFACNLLDNSDFTKFVAQAGVGGNHGTQAYAGDRWILDNGTVTGDANENGNGYSNITLYGTIRQIVANPLDVATAAIEMVSGTATISYADGAVTVTSSGGVIKNIALFPGEFSSDSLPEYVSRGYAAELAECQRYFYSLPHNSILVGYYTSDATEFLSQTIPQLINMRILPTLIMSGTVVARTTTGYSVASGFTTSNGGSVDRLSSYTTRTGGGITLDFGKKAANQNNSPGAINLRDGLVHFSADL